MRKTIAAFVVLGLLWLAYSAWPFAALYDIVRAAQAGDAARIEQRVDFPALRRSLTGQIMQAYARLSGLRVDRGGLMVGLASSLADPMVAKLLTPAALVELLQSGWPKAISAERPSGAEGLKLDAFGSIWQLYAGSDYGVGEFRIAVPASAPPERQYRLSLSLSDWTWKLAGVDLPQEIQERLARELMKEQGKPAS